MIMKCCKKIYYYSYIGDRFIFHKDMFCIIIGDKLVLWRDLSFGKNGVEDFEYGEKIND